MAKQVIGIGTSPNDGSGDPLRTAFTKINSNFTELYNVAANPYQLPVASGNVLGGVKIGNNITMFNGVISVASQVQPDWNATSGLGQILNKPADNVLINGISTVTLTSQGVLSTPGNVQLYDQKQVTSVNANVNNGIGGNGIMGWFAHPDPAYADGANNKVWGLYTEGDIVLRASNGSNSSPYWQFNKDGSFVLPENGTILNSDGTNFIINPASYLKAKTGVPANPQGASGDHKNDIKYDSTHLYVCVADHDGTSVIWKRVAWDNDTWGA